MGRVIHCGESTHRALSAKSLTKSESHAQGSATGPVPHGGLRRSMLRGGLTMTVVSVVSRFSSLGAQLILGRLLLSDDFGLFATALTVAGIGASVRSVVQPMLIHDLEDDERRFVRTYRRSLGGTCMIAVLGMLAAPAIGNLADEPRLAPLLIIMVALMPFEILPVYGVARLNHRLQFGPVATALGFAAIARQIAAVLAAFGGLGAYSLVAGAAVAIATEYVIVRRASGPLPRPGPFSRVAVRELLDDHRIGGSRPERRWLWASAVALTLTINGDYLAASVFAATSTVGLYYFGYVLIGSLTGPVALAANTVLVPGYLRLGSREEHRRHFIDTLRAPTVAGSIVFSSLAVVTAPLIAFLWNGKWDDATVAVIGYLLLAPIWILHPITRAICRGTGNWGLYLSDLVLSGLGTVIAAAVGAATGGLTSIVAWVVGANFFFALLAIERLRARLGADRLRAAFAVLVPWMIVTVGLLVSHSIDPLTDPDPDHLVLRIGIHTAFIAGVLGVFGRSLWRSVISVAIEVAPGPSSTWHGRNS